MSRQAVVGFFAILSILGLFVIFWFISNQGSKLGGYRIAVRFPAAAGLRTGSQVLLSGLSIGTVDRIVLAPDYTVDVILAIKGSLPILSFLPGSAPPNGYDIPKGSRFIIQAPLTGESAVVIIPPPPEHVAGAGAWPHEILPLDQQPSGSPSASFQDVVAQGGDTLKELQHRLPQLLDGMQSAINNANAMAIHGNELTQRLSTRLDRLTGSLQDYLDRAGGNIIAMTQELRAGAHGSRDQLGSLLTRLNSTAVSLNGAVDSMKQLASDPRLHANLIAATENIAQASASLAQAAASARELASDPTAQEQLRDSVANLDAVMQKANSLLAALGGTSNVYGVDAGATPVPAPSGGRATSLPAPVSSAAAPFAAAGPRVALQKFVRNIARFQVRLNELDPGRAGTIGSPILGTNRGPQSDFNMTLFPYSQLSLFTGANNLGPTPNGGLTTYNFALLSTVGPGLRAGGGVLYSRLGLMTQYTPPNHRIGFLGYAYDPQFPTLDAYGTLQLSPKTSIFGGERDILHNGRRTVFGLQLNF
jgi:ABC-type transporter Mla subunit MlaD